MSVVDCEVTSFALRPSAVSFFHHSESATTTPSRALSPTRALAVNDPRSLKMRTASPSEIPRAAASDACMSRLGSFASATAKGMLAKDELRKCRLGGEIMASGYLAASRGLDCTDSRGGTNEGRGSIPIALAVSL